jgi:hypothetical protein
MNGEAASLVIGQSSFTTATAATTQTGLEYPWGLVFDSHGNLWVADYLNSRVLEYVPGTFPCTSGQFCTDMPATLVLGQSSWATGTPATSQTGLYDPRGLSFDSHGNLWVSDSLNYRVLEYAGANALYAVVRGTDNGIYLNWYTGGVWQSWVRLPGATLDTPGAAVQGSTLWVAVEGTDQGIYVSQWQITGETWGGSWTKLPGATSSGPRLTLDSVNNVLYMAVRGTDNAIYYTHVEGILCSSPCSPVWSAWAGIPTGTTSGSPAILVSGGLLYTMVQGTDNGIYYCTWPVAGGAWSTWVRLAGATNAGPSLA